MCHHLSNRRSIISPNQGGFTILELLVVCSVIGLLALLILPAVESARETARRIQCTSNLRQIGLALQSYHSAHNMFAPSQLLTGRYHSTNYYSSVMFILPYLEMRDLFNSINMCFSNTESPGFPILENRTARETKLSVFLCPSDGEVNHTCSYRFNKGRFGVIGSGRSFDGPFTIGFLPSQASVTDGLSRTAFVSECVAGTFTPDQNDFMRNVKTAVSIPFLISSDAGFIPYCLSTTSFRVEITGGRYWFFSGLSNTNYNHNGTPNDRRPSCGQGRAGDILGGLIPPRSLHPDCVNVLFGDGHVQAVTDQTDPRVWKSLGTPDASD